MENRQGVMPHIEREIEKALESRELVNVITEVGGVEGYIFGYYKDPKTQVNYCEIWINKATPEVTRSLENYFLVEPSLIVFITPEKGESYSLPVLRYLDRIKAI